jgi:hypothetical protein
MEDSFEEQIIEIGKEMVVCSNSCKGITNDQINGIVPRCLYYRDSIQNDLNQLIDLEIKGKYEKLSSTREFNKRTPMLSSSLLEIKNLKILQGLTFKTKKTEGFHKELITLIKHKQNFLKKSGQRNINGLIIVGLNPGQINSVEKQFFRTNDYQKSDNINKFLLQNDFFAKNTYFSEPYYKNICLFLQKILNGADCPIIFSEVIYCQNELSNKTIPFATFSNCLNKYLFEIINRFDWPIICFHKESSKFIHIKFPERKIIVVPHASGQYTAYKLKKMSRKHIINIQKIILNSFIEENKYFEFQ